MAVWRREPEVEPATAAAGTAKPRAKRAKVAAGEVTS